MKSWNYPEYGHFKDLKCEAVMVDEAYGQY